MSRQNFNPPAPIHDLPGVSFQEKKECSCGSLGLLGGVPEMAKESEGTSCLLVQGSKEHSFSYQEPHFLHMQNLLP